MDKYKLWIDGVSNEEIGVVLQGAVELSAPQPKFDTVSVPGRNGDLHFFDGSYENRTARVGAYVYRPDNVKSAFGRIGEWLYNSFDYRKIVTDDDLEHFLLGRLENGADIEARIRKLAPFQLSFDCKPQRFLRIGEETIELTIGAWVQNPTIYTSFPLYKIFGNGSGIVNVGQYSATFNNINEYVLFDSETLNAYKGITSMNENVEAQKGLPFENGEQFVSFTGNITKIEIIPRWWEL